MSANVNGCCLRGERGEKNALLLGEILGDETNAPGNGDQDGDRSALLLAAVVPVL